MTTRTIRDMLTNAPNRVDEATNLGTEIASQIVEGLPKIGEALLALAQSRIDAQGLRDRYPGTEIAQLINTTFEATHYDTDTPHSAAYQATQKLNLEHHEAWLAEGTIPEEERPFLEEMREYDALPLDQRKGGAMKATIHVDYGGITHDGIFYMDLDDITVQGNPFGLPYGDTDISELKVEADRITRVEPMIYADDIKLDVLAEAVRVFREAKEDDIRVTVPVTL